MLYGTTGYGGSNGVGTFFKLMPPATSGGTWTEKILYNFVGGNSGSFPTPLVQGRHGVFDGATAFGGTQILGTIFVLNPPTSTSGWTESVLYNFVGGSSGSGPGAPLALDGSGSLYGTTINGGSNACGRSGGCGTVFKLSPPATSGSSWTQSVLDAFTGGHDGYSPGPGGLLLQRGLLFGTTEGGGTIGSYGTAYRIVP